LFLRGSDKALIDKALSRRAGSRWWCLPAAVASNSVLSVQNSRVSAAVAEEEGEKVTQ
jgi:L,D-transpeptidase YnhG